MSFGAMMDPSVDRIGKIYANLLRARDDQWRLVDVRISVPTSMYLGGLGMPFGLFSKWFEVMVMTRT